MNGTTTIDATLNPCSAEMVRQNLCGAGIAVTDLSQNVMRGMKNGKQTIALAVTLEMLF